MTVSYDLSFPKQNIYYQFSKQIMSFCSLIGLILFSLLVTREKPATSLSTANLLEQWLRIPPISNSIGSFPFLKVEMRILLSVSGKSLTQTVQGELVIKR